MTKLVKPENIEKDYASLARNYEKRWAKFLQITHDWIPERLDTPQNVIDLGCGTGLLLKRVQEKLPYAPLTGIDTSAEMLATARKRLPQATLCQADISNAEIKGQFDVVLSVNVLHHLNSPQGHIGSLHRLCTQNGTIFLCDFAIDTLSLKFMEHYWRLFHHAHHMAFSHQKLHDMLTSHFNIEDEAILKPDRFWHLQIYKLTKKQ